MRISIAMLIAATSVVNGVRLESLWESIEEFLGVESVEKVQECIGELCKDNDDIADATPKDGPLPA